MHQTCAGTQKKTNTLKFPGTMGPLLSSCWIFFFGACRCLVHLVVWFFGCLSMFCEVRVTKLAQAPQKKQKKTNQMHQTCTGTKKNKQKKITFPATMGPLLSSCCFFCFFVFFWCLSMFGASSFFVFFFCACQGFCEFHAKIMMKKHVLLGFWTLQMHKTTVFTVFIIILNDNSIPHWVPPSRNMG